MSNEAQTPASCQTVVIGRCSSCKNWSRYSIYDWPNEDKKSNIGVCSALENEVQYWDGIDVAQEKVKDGKIGCENLYTHENFGCIHYNGL